MAAVLRTHNAVTVAEEHLAMVALAQEMGVRMVACEMSMGVMGITREELIDGLDYGGVATYLGDAARSKITLFV